MIFDLVLIFAFQSLHGYVFSWIGLLVASFMAGAACGAMLMAMALARIESCYGLYVKTELAVIGFSLGCPLALVAVNEHLGSPGAPFSRMVFLAISSICGLLIGAQFPLASKVCLGNSTDIARTAGSLYASDLLGGWFGGTVGAVVLLPVLGLVGTCITVGLVKLASLVVVTTQRSRHL
jgi:spermidine synthase